jgi:hypothetical protein
MNDNFGNVSSDFLPPGYGEIESKTIKPVGTPAPAIDGSDTDYGKWKIFGGEGRAKEEEEEAVVEEEESDTDRERGLFLANLGQMFGAAAVSASGGRDPGYRILQGEGDKYIYKQYADNSVDIEPGSPANVGKHLSAGTSVAKKVAKTYGEYEWDGRYTGSDSSDRAANIGTGIGAAATQLLPLFASLLGAQSTTEYDPEAADVGTDDDDDGMSVGLIVGGVAFVGVLGAGIYLLTRSGDGE